MQKSEAFQISLKRPLFLISSYEYKIYNFDTSRHNYQPD